jgi:antitoxin PrlF
VVRHAEALARTYPFWLTVRIADPCRELWWDDDAMPTAAVDLTQVRNFLTMGARGTPMITSRLSSKAQTTIPKAVRGALGLSEGDTIVYQIVESGVLMRRALPEVVDDPFLLFDEWAGDEDREAYADL